MLWIHGKITVFKGVNAEFLPHLDVEVILSTAHKKAAPKDGYKLTVLLVSQLWNP
jgi:hypothetical protein